MRKNLLIPLLCAGLFFTHSVYALEQIADKVSIKQGGDLVELAITGTLNSHLAFGSPKRRSETFMIYQVLGKYEGTAAWLAVNPWTGDVWDMNECSLFSNPKLLEAQAEIKKRFSANELTHYDELHQLKPYREYDLEQCE